MLTKDDYIQVINQLITPPEETWKNDPFEYLLKQIPKNVIEKYGDSQPEDLIPSTSDDVRTVNNDARVQYSQILGGIYLDLAALLKANQPGCSDEYKLLSMQDMISIKKSFEFFLLTGILPFLEPGVGVPASARSSFIKSWKVYDGNAETCGKQLSFAAKVIVALLECNELLMNQFLIKFVYDVLSVRFSLHQLGNTEFEASFAEIFRKCPPYMFLEALMFLTQDRKPTKTPLWIKRDCGKELTKLLIAKNGLMNLLQYYRDRAGENWTDNLPITKQVASHIATVPKLFKHPIEYHDRMSKQFFATMYCQKTIDKNLLAVFVCYVEELRTRFSRNCDVTVFDRILMFWEKLNKKLIDRTNPMSDRVIDFSKHHIRNIQILAQIQASMDPRRIRNIFPVIFACVEIVPFFKEILKTVLEATNNVGMNLYHHVMTPSHAVILKTPVQLTSPLIVEMDNANEEKKEKVPEEEMWLQGIEEADLAVARRLENVFYIVDNALTQQQFRTILDLLGYGLDDFLKASEKEKEDDLARFVDLGGAAGFTSFHAHLVVGCSFERMMSMAKDSGFSPEECLQLLKIAENILNSATMKYMRWAERKKAVDVFQMKEGEKKELIATSETAKMAVSVVSTIYCLTQHFNRFHDNNLKALDSLANFIKAFDAFDEEDPQLKNTVDEARRMLRQLKFDIATASAPVAPPRNNHNRRFSGGDQINDIIDELNDEEPAIRGGTLMTLARYFKTRVWQCNRLLEFGVFDVIKELIDDDDSYVYLAAINCVCEAAIFDRHYFDELINFYVDLSAYPQKPDKIIVRLARLAEAISKLFTVRGDFVVTYMDRMAKVFLKGMTDDEEILRASACGAFGNFFNASRGRGIEKYIQQLFAQLHRLIQADRSPLVRRAAIDLVRQVLRAVGTDMFETLRDVLFNLHRDLRTLKMSDRDETIRLHAELCIDEISAALNQNHEETERGYTRRLRF